MPMAESLKLESRFGRYCFGSCVFDVANSSLQKGESRFSLTQKQSDILFLLVSNAGATISKDQFLRHIWPDQVVEEGNLTTYIHALRKMLEEDPGAPTLIVTVQGQGYRFARKVRPCDSVEAAETAAPAQHNDISLSVPRPGWWRSKIALLTIVGGCLLALLTCLLQPKPAPTAPTPLIAIPLTTLIGAERYPAISPDGKYIAFTWDSDQLRNDDIYVQQVTGSQMVRITTDPASDIQPTWSPDSLNLAFLRGANFPGTPLRLMITPAFGGYEREVAQVYAEVYAEMYGGLDWSPDGRHLAVAGIAGGSDASGIHILSVDGQSRRQISQSDPTGKFRDSNPRFSPDGGSVAFLRLHGENKADIFLASLTDNKIRQITRERQSIQNGTLQWDPGGKGLRFFSDQQGNWGLYQAPLDGDRIEQFPGIFLPKLPFNLIRAQFYLSLSDKANLLAFASVLEDNRIEVYGGSGGPESPCPINSTKSEINPQLSPDGSRLAFISTRSGIEQLWVSSADCTGQRQITSFTERGAGNPRWSPDGGRIAFDRQNEGVGVLYVIDADGSNLRQIGEPAGSGTFPSWSPDGEWLYFTSNRTEPDHPSQIWKIRVAGGQALPVTYSDESAKRRPQITPDGRTLYFTRNNRLWQMDIAGGTETPVKELAGIQLDCNWEVTAEGIYYYQTEAVLKSTISKLDLLTRRTSPFAKVDGEMPAKLQSLSVLGAGRRYAASSVYIRFSDINLIRNWR